jgi:hypothetical protein
MVANPEPHERIFLSDGERPISVFIHVRTRMRQLVSIERTDAPGPWSGVHIACRTGAEPLQASRHRAPKRWERLVCEAHRR